MDSNLAENSLYVASYAVEFAAQPETWPVFWEFMKVKHGPTRNHAGCPVCDNNPDAMRKALVVLMTVLRS